MIPADLEAAQYRYMALTGAQISQTEVQRLSGALRGGATVEAAAQAVHEFFSRPIDWEAERQAFARWIADRRQGVIAAMVEVRCGS